MERNQAPPQAVPARNFPNYALCTLMMIWIPNLVLGR